jgi:hypothetical protein
MTFPDDDLPDPRTAELLGRVPRSVQPRRDLWPGVEGRLKRRIGAGVQGRRWIVGAAIAATILIAASLQGPATRDPRPDTESAEVQATLIATTGPRSATAHSLAKHLSILDGAIAETEAALRETPGDPALVDFLQTLQHRRLTLLAQAARYAAES